MLPLLLVKLGILLVNLKTKSKKKKRKYKPQQKQIKRNKQIWKIVAPCPATNFTLRQVKVQGHRMIPIERACHNDHTCQASMLYH